jgi:hypothetical protein
MIMWTAREFRSFDRHGMAFPGMPDRSRCTMQREGRHSCAGLPPYQGDDHAHMG